jgi:RNase adaptor protein for sRNA GlmZ degradation
MKIIVSGLERSGTSLMMQILLDAGYDLCYDDSRKPDEHNPNGYFELYDGKIITELMYDNINLDEYNNKVIKITAFGLTLLKGNDYKVIFMERNINEVIQSQDKMMNYKYSHPLSYKEKNLLNKVVSNSLKYLDNNNIPYIIINYNNLINNSKGELNKLTNFLGKDITNSAKVIDNSLYRNRC